MTNTHLLHRLAWASGMMMLLSLAATPGRAADKPILIGATSSETGAFAADAEYNLNGMKLAIEEKNAKGGWLGRKLELKIYDDESNPGRLCGSIHGSSPKTKQICSSGLIPAELHNCSRP